MFTIHVIHRFENNADDEFKRKVLQQFELLNIKISKMANELDNLTTEVAEMKTVQQSAVTLLQGLKQRLDEAGTDAAKLAELSADIDASTNALAAAITANTPADPNNPQP